MTDDGNLPDGDLNVAPTGDAVKVDPAAKTYDENYVQSLRKENAKYRTERNELSQRHASMLEAVAKKLGIQDPEQDPLATIEALKQENKNLKVSGKLSKVVKEAALNEELAMAVLKAENYFESLDPDDPEFDKKVSLKLTEIEKKHPVLKAKAPIKTGADFNEPKGKTSADMDSMIRRLAGFQKGEL